MPRQGQGLGGALSLLRPPTCSSCSAPLVSHQLQSSACKPPKAEKSNKTSTYRIISARISALEAYHPAQPQLQPKQSPLRPAALSALQPVLRVPAPCLPAPCQCSRISPCLPQEAKQLKVSPNSFLPCCRAMYTPHLKPSSSPKTHPTGSVEPFGTASTQNLQIPNSLLHSRLYIPSSGRHRNTDYLFLKASVTTALPISAFAPSGAL